jgi:PhnB protein
MKLIAHLNFNGQCAEAFRFYEKCLNGKIRMMMTWGESPMAAQTPQESHGQVMHATLEIGDQMLMGADSGGHYQKPQGFAVTVNVDDPAEADRIFAALAEAGDVQMPIQATFWALRFGMVTDRFGTPWMINCGNPA